MLAGSASATTFTWDGGGSDNDITTAQNWVGDVVPSANSDIIWAGTVRLNVNVNIGGPGNSFTFSNTAGAFIISGAAASLSSGVTNNSTNLETINIPLTLTGAQTFNAASGNLRFGGATLDNGGFLLTVGGANNTTITNVISGSGGLTKTGAGTLFLTGANSYTGAAAVSAGVLNIQNATGLGTTVAGTTVTSGAALQLQGGIAVGNETLTLNGTGLSNTGALRNISGNNSWAGTITINSTTRINSDSGTLTLDVASGNAITGSNDNLQFGGAGNVTINDVIATGSGTLTKKGTGTLTLNAANTFTGVTTVSAGVLNIRNATGLGTTAGGTTVTSGAALQLQGGIAVGNETLSLNGTGLSNTGALRNISGNNSWAGTITINSTTRINSDSGTLTLDVASGNAITGSNDNLQFGGAGNVTINDAIATGTGTLTKDGTGTLVLNASNTYTGATNVNAGTLRISASDRIANTSNLNVSGGTFDVQTYSETVGTVTLSSGSIAGTGAGRVTASSYAVQSGTTSAILAGTGATMTKTTTGTVTLTGANTFTGATTVNAGVLNIQNATGLGTIAGGTTVSNGATLQLQGGITVGSETLNIRGTGAGGQTGALVNVSGTNNYGGLLTLAGATTLSSNSGILNLTNTGTITGATFGLTLTGAGNGSISSIIGTTTGSLTKSGTGTWTLSGANTFTGATTINGGTLIAASSSGGALRATGNVLVNWGGTVMLGGNNQINNTATITLAGGTFDKGSFSEGTSATPGMGALILTAFGSEIDFGNGTVGSLTFASFNPGAFSLTVSDWTGTPGVAGNGLTDRLIFNSDQTTNLSSFIFNGYGAGALQLDLLNGFYEITPVPEPATYLSGLLALAVVLFHHRRQIRALFRRRSATKGSV